MSAEVTLGWNNARLAAGARQASAIVDGATSRMRSALGGLAAAGGSFLAVREIVDATVKYDSLRLGMVSLTGSVEAATDRMSELRTLAKDPGLGFAQVVETDIRLRSAGISASVSERAIREFGNALAVVGKGKEELDGVALALSQIASKGKVSAEEINQIAERVPQIRTVMKDVFGTADTEEIQKMGIPVESFITLIVDGFSRTIPRAIIGLQGKWDNFTDALTGRLADFGDAASKSVIGPIEEITAALDGAEGTFKTAGTAIGEVIGGFSDLGNAALVASKSVGGDYLNAQVAAFQAIFGGIPVIRDLTDKVEAYNNAQKIANDISKAATQVIDRQAEAEANLAKEKSELNSYLDVYMAKQSRANAETEAAASAAKKQADALDKLKSSLASASEKTSMSFAPPKVQQQREVKNLEKIDAQINMAEFAGDEQKAIQLKIEKEAVLQRIGQLEEQIKASTEAQDKANQDLVRTETERMLAKAEQVAAQEQAMQLFALELAIAEAASRGQDAKVAKLERERDIIEQTTRLMNELGIGYDEAAKMAERLVNAETKAEARKNGGDGERSKIRGYSQDQGDAAAARTRAGGRVDEARANATAATTRGFSSFAEIDAAQKTKFGNAFGNAPAEQAAVKTESPLTQVMDRLDKWANSTSETIEKAFQ
jgi:tape measure domain-containing protein